MEREELQEAIRTFKRRINFLKGCPHRSKHKEIEAKKLQTLVISLENSLFSQPIHRFNKKNPQFTKLEEKHLGSVKALGLRTTTTKRDSMPRKSVTPFQNH